jgi:hypothetical protein
MPSLTAMQRLNAPRRKLSGSLVDGDFQLRQR